MPSHRRRTYPVPADAPKQRPVKNALPCPYSLFYATPEHGYTICAFNNIRKGIPQSRGNGASSPPVWGKHTLNMHYGFSDPGMEFPDQRTKGAIGSGHFSSLFEELHWGIRRYRPVSLISILFPSGSSRSPTRVSSLTVSSFFDSSTQNIHPPTLPAVLSSKWASSSPYIQ